MTDAAADVTAERAEPAPEPVLAAAGGEETAAEAAGAEEAELAGAEEAELAGADVAAGEAGPALEPVPDAAGCELVEDGEALASETAPLTADVAWETACPTADDPAPEPPWDAPDVACVAVETADPSANDRPPADEPPPPGLDAADAEPAVRNERPMARPMAAAAAPAAYRHSRRTVVTSLPATSGNLANDARDVHVRERPQSGQMSTRLPLIPRSRPGSTHPHFRYFRLWTDVPAGAHGSAFERAGYLTAIEEATRTYGPH
ncbi:MAG TPA: hypothetical protein VLL69_01775 [Streptosporangiaceae bacterium]|nr:hypothetical protein [Streptosporangiaceae bacterium]